MMNIRSWTILLSALNEKRNELILPQRSFAICYSKKNEQPLQKQLFFFIDTDAHVCNFIFRYFTCTL